MAPKKKEKNLKRSNIITLKLTDIELAVLNEATGITGLSRSEYLRKLLLAPFAHSFASTSELLPPRKLVDMINTFFCHNQISPFSASFLTLRITFAGTPAAIILAGTSFVTTAPAAMIEPLPIVTPERTVTFAPIHTFFSI